MKHLRNMAVAFVAAAGGLVALSGAAQAQYYYDGGPRYYEPAPRYAPQPRYYQPERQYYGGGGGYYVDRDTALRNARALKEAQKRAIKEGRPVPGVYNAPQQRYAQPAPRYAQPQYGQPAPRYAQPAPQPRYAPNPGFYGQTPGQRAPTRPMDNEIYRNGN
ncbi:MAG: hypothetical protein ACRDBH_03860 [Bosea sp. (in: a-proteobacteria)]